MKWPDCLVDRSVTAKELVSSLSSYLLVDASTVLIVDEVPSHGLPGTTTMMCERQQVRGDFVLKLSFYPQNEKIDTKDGYQFIEFLSATQKCRCLVPDTSENPYSMLLIEGTNSCREVFLEVDRMDREPEEYVIARERSVS